MSKKRIKKLRAQERSSKDIQVKAIAEAKIFNKLKIYLGILIAVFAFMLYSRSIRYEFTLDDGSVIQENNVTKEGLSGIPTILKTDYWYGSGHNTSRGPIYRPTSLIVFAIIWQFSPNSPDVYHFINVLFYALSCLLLFLVLCQLFKNQNLLFPFICTVLYTAHPIHTEVVNNIKSLDEILCFLFGLASIWLFFKQSLSRSRLFYILGGICFFLALISKETGITFLVIIPITIYFFTDTSLKKIGYAFFFLLAIAAGWSIIRMIVFKDLPSNTENTAGVLNNTLYAAPDNISRYATAFYILLKYIFLLLFPHPLSYDYSFSQIKIQSIGNAIALTGIVFYLVIAFYCLLKFRKKNIVAFGILFFLITLSPVSNLFFLVAATMAERFMYIPSLGFCIVLTYFLIKITKEENRESGFKNPFQFFALHKQLFFIVFIICALYYYKTTSRSANWKDNLTLFGHDVEVADNSARTNQTFGSALMLSAMKASDKQNQSDTLSLAKKYLEKALQIYPEFYVPLSHLGVIYIYENKFDSAYNFLDRAVKIMPDDVDVNFNLGLALFHLRKNEEAIKVFNNTIRLAPTHEEAYYNLAALYLITQDYDKALLNYSKVIKLNPANANAYYNSAEILRYKGDTSKANEYIQKAKSLGYKQN